VPVADPPAPLAGLMGETDRRPSVATTAARDDGRKRRPASRTADARYCFRVKGAAHPAAQRPGRRLSLRTKRRSGGATSGTVS